MCTPVEECTYYKKEQICVLCGFDISKCEREHPIHDRGRQWARSRQFKDKWICGLCRDDLQDEMED
jgi:hypothetical protein